jgi:hypothetical protein
MTHKAVLLLALSAFAAAQTVLPDEIPEADLTSYGVGSYDDAAFSAVVQTDRVVKLCIMQRVYGKIVGDIQRQFLGIPYAKARRFEAPRKLTLWERLGTKNATVFGASCKSKPGSTNGI